MAVSPRKCAGPQLGVKGLLPMPRQPQGQPGVTSVPGTSEPQEGAEPVRWPLCPQVRVVPGEPVCVWAGCQPPGRLCPLSRQLRRVPALHRRRRGMELAARFLPSPWSRRDRLGNPIMVRLRRRVDLGFIAVSVLNRE